MKDFDVRLVVVADKKYFHVRLMIVLHEFSRGDELGILLLVWLVHEENLVVGLVCVADDEDLGFRWHGIPRYLDMGYSPGLSGHGV